MNTTSNGLENHPYNDVWAVGETPHRLALHPAGKSGTCCSGAKILSPTATDFVRKLDYHLIFMFAPRINDD